MDVDTLFLAGGAIIFTGFISNYLFRRFKAPDVLILMFLGMIMGPGAIGLISSEVAQNMEVVTPYVASIPFSYPTVFSEVTAGSILGVTVMVILLTTALASVGAFYLELHIRHQKKNGNGRKAGGGT